MTWVNHRAFCFAFKIILFTRPVFIILGSAFEGSACVKGILPDVE